MSVGVTPEAIQAALDDAVQKGVLEPVGEGYRLTEIGMTNAYHHGIEFMRVLRSLINQDAVFIEIVGEVTNDPHA